MEFSPIKDLEFSKPCQQEQAETAQQNPEWQKCANDPVYWINTYCKTFDPRLRKWLDFHLYGKQETLIRWIQEREENQEDGIVEKSRDTGISYVCCAYALHQWLFKPNSVIGFGSRKREYVDTKGAEKSLFEKIRGIMRRLPEWQIPSDFNWRTHDNECLLINPSNGSQIVGEGGDNIGRGARTTLYFVDESAFIEHQELLDSSLSATTNVRIDVSTPNGLGNPFHTKRFSGEYPVFTYHWTDDPRKTLEWAEAKKRKNPTAFAQEYDIDYSASISGICIPAKWVRSAVNFFQSERFREIYGEYQPSGETTAGLDVSDEGENLSVFIPRRGSEILTAIAWGQMNTTQTAFKAKALCFEYSVKHLNYDVVGVGAGVKGTLDSSSETLPFQANPINWGASPTEDIFEDFDGRPAKELFTNLKAELTWKLRKRFERVYEFVEFGIRHDPEEMISIPDEPNLIAQLSLELYKYTETGKIKIESKDELKKRGIQSPDYKDALAYSFAPVPILHVQFMENPF